MLALGGGAALCSANVEAESDPFQFEALEADPLALIKRFEDFERCAEARATEAVVARAFGRLTGKTWRLVENEGGEEKMRLDGESWVKRKAYMKLPLTITYKLEGTTLHSDICALKFLHVVEAWRVGGAVKEIVAKGQTVRQQYGVTSAGARPFIRKSEISAAEVKSESVAQYHLSDDGWDLRLVTWCAYPDAAPPTLAKYTMHMRADEAPPRAPTEA